MLLHPKQGYNAHPVSCIRCGRTMNDKMLMGLRNYVDECPKCGTQYYGGCDHRSCINCKEPYTKNSAYAKAMWRRRELKHDEPVPSKAPCGICENFIREVENASKTGGIGVRCAQCGSEHVIGGDNKLAIHAREQLKIDAPNVAYVIVRECFNCNEVAQQKTHALVNEANQELQRVKTGDTSALRHYNPEPLALSDQTNETQQVTLGEAITKVLERERE